MKRWKQILLILLAVILLAQIPFIHRRFQTGNLTKKIDQLQSQRTNLSNPNFNEYKGIIHAHTNLGGHSTATFDELIGAAASNEFDFVVMTEHFSQNYDTSALTLNGFYGKTLFVGGNEVDTASVDRFLMIPGGADAYNLAFDKTETFLAKVHSQNRIALITYPERFKTWDANFDGIEVFSLHTNAKKMNPVIFPLDALWSYGKYPKQLLAKYFVRPDANLQKYDEISANRKITLFSGTDAHSNIGFHLLGDDAGNKLINIKLDDYATIFGLTRAHVLLKKDKEFTRENLIEAIKNGNLFVGIDVLGDTSGFSFTAETSVETKIQGDEIALQNGVKLKSSAPQIVRFVIFKNGEKVFEEGGKSEIFFEAKEKGAYRVEVYLDELGSPFDKMPWIFSNPIYIR